MRFFLVLILSNIILTTSCSKDDILDIKKDDNGIVIALPYLWKKTLHESGKFTSNGFIRDPIYYNNNIGIPTTNGGTNRFLTMINAEDGATLWQWDDRYYKDTEYIDIYSKYQHGNLLTYQKGGRSYCINLDNGKTHWKIQRNNSFHVTVSGLESTYFTLGESESLFQDYQEYVGYKGNIETGAIEEIIIPDFTLEHIIANRIGDVTRIEPYTFNGVQHLAITWQELTDDAIWNFQTYLGLYNYETNVWVYKKQFMNEPNLNGVVLAPPVIYQDKIYTNIGHQLFCHNLATGNQVWKRDFTQDFMFSGFVIEEGKIIANNEDTYTYCLNPENGSIIWKEKSAGTSGRISYLNGIAYFVGGSTGKLHAIDVSTGKTVWKIDGKKLDGEIFKTNAVYVLPAKNGNPAKVIALTHLNAYCFEAYQ